MRNYEREVILAQLGGEKDVLRSLEKEYRAALEQINEKIKLLQSDELTQSRVYQIQYQQALKGQIEAILEKLHGDEYSTIQQYLSDSYSEGFLGTMYSVHKQGIPVIIPIDKNAAVKAVLTDSKLSAPLYEALGLDIKAMKRSIRAEISRGIASGMSYADIARNLQNATKAPFDRAKTIVRTEGHRIQQESAEDARQEARKKGADVVKQWDATLDGATRATHRNLDGQIKETDEPFAYGGKKAMYPGAFGDPAEDCNCRCVALTRARWALDEEELATLKERAAFFGLDKQDSFEDFKKKYLKAAETLKNKGKSGIISLNLQAFAEKDLSRQKTLSLKKGLASFKEQIVTHRNKIARPWDYIPGWDEMDERMKAGLKRHWEKEISNFQKSVESRIAELKRRGEYDE